jgi:RHS repeat-associated protein
VRFTGHSNCNFDRRGSSIPSTPDWRSLDSDGSRVTLGTTVSTYYPGKHYSKKVKNGTTKVQKYYAAMGALIAVRTVTGGSDTLQWLITDHLGSTTVTANTSGSLSSEIRYSAFGEIRYINGITPTNYRYTGQLDDSYIKLDWYNSRWYDSYLNHWIQPDSIIPDPYNSTSWDSVPG